jgi:hypothetical protein
MKIKIETKKKRLKNNYNFLLKDEIKKKSQFNKRIKKKKQMRIKLKKNNISQIRNKGCN